MQGDHVNDLKSHQAHVTSGVSQIRFSVSNCSSLVHCFILPFLTFTLHILTLLYLVDDDYDIDSVSSTFISTS